MQAVSRSREMPHSNNNVLRGYVAALCFMEAQYERVCFRSDRYQPEYLPPLLDLLHAIRTLSRDPLRRLLQRSNRSHPFEPLPPELEALFRTAFRPQPLHVKSVFLPVIFTLRTDFHPIHPLANMLDSLSSSRNLSIKDSYTSKLHFAIAYCWPYVFVLRVIPLFDLRIVDLLPWCKLAR
jgi:hypothetical protein